MTSDRAADPSPPFRGLDWNDNEHLERMPPSKELLVQAEYRVHRWLYRNAALRLISLDMFAEFHRVMFEDVWPEFAGRLRGPSPQYINRAVTFSNFRGVDPDQVHSHLSRLFERMQRVIRDLDDGLAHLSPAFAAESVRNIAAHLHCDVVRIHPFVNGNGRTARMCVNYVAVRYGYRLVDWDAIPKSEYIDATRTFMQQRSWQHFADLLEQHLAADQSELP